MAEFCAECFSKVFNEKPRKWKYLFSEEPDLCDGCGEWKRVVVRIRYPKLYTLKMKIRARIRGLKRKK